MREKQVNRALDALVAEKVMGWHWDDDWGCLIPPQQRAKPWEMWAGWRHTQWGSSREPVKEAHVPGVHYSGDSTKILLPRYFTDETDAFKVVKYMEERGYVLYPLQRVIGVVGCMWEARFVTNDDPAGLPWEAGWSGQGWTAAEAICRAALEWADSGHQL